VKDSSRATLPTLNSPITSRFGDRSTALEVVQDLSLAGRNAVVTGGASGLGLETSRALVAGGAAVTVAVCNLAQGEAAAAVLRQDYPACHHHRGAA
jgi:phosphate/sulfate permease